MKVYQDHTSGMMSLHLNPVSYFSEQFVNKVIEYSTGKFLAAVWDSTKYITIDHEQERMGKHINHPQAAKGQVRCWGIEKVPGFDMLKMPFLIARDNTGIVLVDVKNHLAYQFALAPIKANLFGHGDILKVVQTETHPAPGKRAVSLSLWTVLQYSE